MPDKACAGFSIDLRKATGETGSPSTCRKGGSSPKVPFSFLLALFLLVWYSESPAVDPSLEWRTLRTPHFRIHFPAGQESFAGRIGEIAERVHRILAPRLGWQPQQPVQLVLSDESGWPNGMASVSPFTRMLLFPMVPDDIGELADSDDWFKLLIVHEYSHVLHLDQARGIPAGLRRVFGRNPLLFPNVLQPAWLKEGLATYMETDDEGGYGRGQSAYYRMLMRLELLRGLKPLQQVNLPLRSWPAGVTDYLYGVYFYRYLAQRYGEDAPRRLVEAYSDNLIPFRIDSNPRSPFGKDLKALWREFEQWLQEAFAPEFAELQREGVVAGEPVVSLGEWGGMARATGEGVLYFIHDDGYRRPWLVRWEAGIRRRVVELRKGARLDLHEQAGVLITQPESCGLYNIYYDLYRYREGEKRLRRLTRCGRIRWAAWNPQGDRIAAVKGTEQGVELWLLDEEANPLRRLWRAGREVQLSHLDWSPDGRELVAAVWQRGSGWSLRRFHLQEERWETLLADGSVVGQPQYTPTGDGVLFVSDHGGFYNLRRLDLRGGGLKTLTRVEGGAFYPVQGSREGAIYYVNQGPRGRVLYRLDGSRSLPRIQRWSKEMPVPAAVAGTDPVVSSGYSAWETLRPRYWFPHLFFSPGVAELGMTTSGQDALGIHGYTLDVAAESRGPAWVGAFSYRYSNRFSLLASRYNDYRLNDQAEPAGIRRRDSLQAGIDFPFRRLDYRWNLGLAAAGTWERELWSGGGEPTEPARDRLAGLLFSFDDSRWYHYAISRSDGREINLAVESSDLPGSDFSGVTTIGEWREYLRLGRRQVAALRLVFGWGSERPKPFQLGGAGGAALDGAAVGDLRLNRRRFPLRGYPAGLGALRGRRMQLASLEWRFPLGLIERGIMAPPAGLLQWSGQLFVDSGAAWEEGGSPEHRFTGAGIELLADVNLFYLIDLRLRLGYAHGFDRAGGDRFYLSLGDSF